MSDMQSRPRFDSPEALDAALAGEGYVSDADLRMTLYLAMALHKPLLVEGPAGVGKTEIAKALAATLDTRLIRLQCYEGLDAAQALADDGHRAAKTAIAVRQSQVHNGEVEGPALHETQGVAHACRFGNPAARKRQLGRFAQPGAGFCDVLDQQDRLHDDSPWQGKLACRATPAF